ncbi:MAG: dCTP deaminase [Candidatus Gracilibacteria bacterium]|nr:dCTP deaminase [Candidatus Gracilibacteria bacterium]
MILADSEIKRRLEIGDLIVENNFGYDVNKQIGPASLDFRLGKTFKYYRKSSLTLLDPTKGDSINNLVEAEFDTKTPFILHPGDFVLGVTMEKIKIPDDLVARCEGRSSIGRLGVVIHSTAGFIDPGFEGTITLEITNINNVPIALYPGMRILNNLLLKVCYEKLKFLIIKENEVNICTN